MTVQISLPFNKHLPVAFSSSHKIALLLQQKKEKEKLIQQTRKQFDATMKANTEKILHSSQKEFELVLKRRSEELNQLKKDVQSELETMNTKHSQIEQEMQLHFSKIKQLQEQYSQLIDCNSVLQTATTEYSKEIRQMSDRLREDYQKKVKSIKKKSVQQKHMDIQVEFYTLS